MSGPVDFRRVEAADLPLMVGWLMQPHVRSFYQKEPITLEEAAAEYGPMIRGEEPTFGHLALSDGRPFAYLQCYRARDYPDWADMIGLADGISVDLYIGEPDFLRGGWGRAILSAYLRDVAFPAYPDEPRAYIAHELGNERALACSIAVGFQPLRIAVEDGVEEQLLVLERGRLQK